MDLKFYDLFDSIKSRIKITIKNCAVKQALLEEQAEEQRARELEKQLAMMEMDPNRTIMLVFDV